MHNHFHQPREQYFRRFALKILKPFAEQFPIQYIQGNQGCPIAYRHFVHQPQADKLIILVNGRAENILKWTEIAYDFYQQGYDVVTIDHRGQGYSGRLLGDPELGYIDQFHYYADDLAKTLQELTALFPYKQQVMLAHSMGALISSFYLANYDHAIQRAVLSSPFYSVPLRRPLIDQMIIRLMTLCGYGNHYVFGKGAYQPVDEHQNKLSHCPTRMKMMNEINQRLPQLHLGGPTFQWAHHAIQTIKQLNSILPTITIPVLVLQAEQEEIVSNKTLQELTALFPQGELVLIPQAKHEILFETDSIRQSALRTILAFFGQ